MPAQTAMFALCPVTSHDPADNVLPRLYPTMRGLRIAATKAGVSTEGMHLVSTAVSDGALNKAGRPRQRQRRSD